MSAVFGIGGWLLAVAGLAAATLIRIRLSRHTEAVARACHELRGPLTAVRLGLELGARIRQLPHSRLRALELELGRATLALDDLSGAWTQRRPVRAEPVDIDELVGDSAEAWGAVAVAQGARLRVNRSGERLLVTGERLRLAQAVGNLIANAIEHGGEAVHVGVRAAPPVIRVEIADCGPGLPAPIEELIHSDRRRRRTHHGRGAERGHGLAVVRAVAAAHGGRVTTTPSERGTRVVLELPATPARAAYA